jgi:hypothetical protein
LGDDEDKENKLKQLKVEYLEKIKKGIDIEYFEEYKNVLKEECIDLIMKMMEIDEK